MTDDTNMEMPALIPENIEPVERDDKATGRYLIEPFLQATKTSEGLEMSAGDGHATPVYGRVMKATPNARFRPGDAVLFRRYAIDSLKAYTSDGEKEVYLLEEQEIIGIVHGGVEPRDKQSNTAQISELQNNGKKDSGPEEGRQSEETSA